VATRQNIQRSVLAHLRPRPDSSTPRGRCAHSIAARASKAVSDVITRGMSATGACLRPCSRPVGGPGPVLSMPRTRCAGGSSWLEAPPEQGVRSPARSPRSFLAFAEGGEHTLTEIARLTGLPVSTAHRLTAELASWRMLERKDEGLYRAGLPLRVDGTGAARPASPSGRRACWRIWWEPPAAAPGSGCSPGWRWPTWRSSRGAGRCRASRRWPRCRPTDGARSCVAGLLPLRGR
jgi:hypothetical protein